jgi:hypothetical protein
MHRIISALKNARRTINGLREFRSKDHRIFYPWGLAMNGQTSRLEATRQIIFALEIEYIVETGTFRGTTTEWFGQFGIPVDTVEISTQCFSFSKARLAKIPGISVFLGSSVPFLKKRTLDTLKNKVHFFYLDAHWEDYLPLREELELIF